MDLESTRRGPLVITDDSSHGLLWLSVLVRPPMHRFAVESQEAPLDLCVEAEPA